MTRVAFIGLGNMGAPMAQNLIKAGFSLSVFDLVKETVHQLVKSGATAAAHLSLIFVPGTGYEPMPMAVGSIDAVHPLCDRVVMI